MAKFSRVQFIFFLLKINIKTFELNLLIKAFKYINQNGITTEKSYPYVSLNRSASYDCPDGADENDEKVCPTKRGGSKKVKIKKFYS